MIEGVVNAAYEPVVVPDGQGPSGQTSEVEATIDTGFTGFLTVTPAFHVRWRQWWRHLLSAEGRGEHLVIR